MLTIGHVRDRTAANLKCAALPNSPSTQAEHSDCFDIQSMLRSPSKVGTFISSAARADGGPCWLVLACCWSGRRQHLSATLIFKWMPCRRMWRNAWTRMIARRYVSTPHQ